MSEESDLVKGVRGWLEKQGYPLEMRVAGEFEKRGFDVVQSPYYVLDGQTPRELDVTAWLHVEDIRLRWQPVSPKAPGLKEAVDRAARQSKKDVGPSDTSVFAAEAGVIIECKSGPAKRPWIAFTSRNSGLSLFEVLSAYPMTDLALDGFSEIGETLTPEDLPLFSPRPRYAHSVVPAALGDKEKEQKSEDGYDVAYSAVKKAAEASRHYADLRNKGYGKRLVRLCVPTVVVSTPLIECWLHDGKLQVEARDELVVRFDRPGADGDTNVTHVHLVQEQALPAFIESVLTTFAVIQPNLDRLSKIIRKRIEVRRAAARFVAPSRTRRDE